MSYYVDCNDDGEETSYYKRPKWMTPTSDFQKRFLNAVGCKFYGSKADRSAVIAIEKSMAPFALNPERPPRFPTEWVDEKIAFVISSRRKGKFFNIKGLLTMINNEALLQEWVDKRKTEFVKRPARIQIEGVTLEVAENVEPDLLS